MKKTILLFSCLILLLSGCSNNDPSQIKQSNLIGLWGLSADKNPKNDNRYEEFVRFKDDGTFEYYWIGADKYSFHRGTYSVDEKSFALVYKDIRTFVIDHGIIRYTFSSKDSRYWDRANFPILAVSSKLITTGDNEFWKYYFHATESLSSEWPSEEIIAPETPVTEQALPGQWDLVSYYQIEAKQYTWWNIITPEEQGITLLSGGNMVNAYFWANCIYNQLSQTGEIAADENIYINYSDIRWLCNQESITLTCTKCQAIRYDGQGNKLSERVIDFATPFAMRFTVQSFNPYYMIMYSPDADKYFVFHKNQASSAVSRKHAPATDVKGYTIATHASSNSVQCVENNKR